MGGKGGDMIFGQSGADVIYGEDGPDTIYGGAGKGREVCVCACFFFSPPPSLLVSFFCKKNSCACLAFRVFRYAHRSKRKRYDLWGHEIGRFRLECY